MPLSPPPLSYIPTIMMERPLYQREINDGLYHPHSYYLTKWVGGRGGTL